MPADDLVIGRGQRGSTPLGTTIFVGLRALDGFVLQRALQVLNPLPVLANKLGLSAPVPAPSGGSPLTLSNHDLTPFQAVIWAMSMGSAVKQIFWILYISNEPMYSKGAIIISLFNTVNNSINTLMFSAAGSNPTWSPYFVYIGSVLYLAGIAIETISEVQRKHFKDQPQNEGKLYSAGLFGYARSINYFGYSIWRASFSLAAGGILGPISFAFFAWDFTSRAIPTMDRYCSKRYGEQWQRMKEKVPYGFCPGVC